MSRESTSNAQSSVSPKIVVEKVSWTDLSLYVPDKNDIKTAVLMSRLYHYII